MKTRIMIISLLVLTVLILFLSMASSRTKPGLGSLQISMAGYTNLVDGRRVAVFPVTNTNECPVAFEVFGPRVRHDDGTWPNFWTTFGKAQILPAGATAKIQIPPPNEVADWRIMIGCARAPTTRERFEQRIRMLQSKYRLREFVKAPHNGYIIRAKTIEVAPNGSIRVEEGSIVVD
jgi:hypothetical protein